MKKSKWDEEQLKVLLSQLPMVKDDRSANQIYQKLWMAKPQHKSSKKRIGAFTATVLVLFLLMLITPQLVEQNSSQNGEAHDLSSQGKINEAKHGHSKVSSDQPKHEESFVVSKSQKDDYVTLAFINQSKSVIVPVSIRKNDTITNVKEAYNAFRQFEDDHFESIDTYFQHIKFTEQKQAKKMTIQVNDDVPDISVNELELVKEMINDAFKWGAYESVQFVSNGEPGIEFSSSGVLVEIPIEQHSKKGYFLYESSEGRQFLAPSNDQYHNIEEAIHKMQTNANSSYLKSIISDNQQIKEIDKEGNKLTMQFSADIHNDVQTILMIEGLLMTAKDFGFTKVKFVNTNITRVGHYDLSKSVPVPYAPNPITIKG
ncbi:RsiX protein [Bacillus sp. CLL-7-23]|uniref:RsiX protein n=1 Tax=Bacillus changyiensis TaxID=3004103 RepID=A0ABT4X6Q3_9BACI|nr:RsiX protein [Bacillus changyiensis]MDA7027777.1 RsiX protein [Bacillus changyiensis]